MRGVFHWRARRAIADRLAEITCRLHAARSQCSEQQLDVEGFEARKREIQAPYVEAEREVLAEEFERLEVDVPARLGGALVRDLHQYGRRGDGEAHAVAPLELRSGFVEGHWAPLAARQASYLVA